jgi:hypothetical protein
MAKKKSLKKRRKETAYKESHPIIETLNDLKKFIMGKLKIDIWAEIDKIHFAEKNTWSPFCYIPESRLIKLLTDTNLKCGGNQIDINDSESFKSKCIGLMSLAAWRRFKQIYKFDTSLRDALLSIDFKRDETIIEKQELKYLPVYGFYLDESFEADETTFSGVYVYIDVEPQSNCESINLMYEVSNLSKYATKVVFFSIPLTEDTTYKSMIAEHCLDGKGDSLIRVVYDTMKLIAYLSCKEKDVERDGEYKTKRKSIATKKSISKPQIKDKDSQIEKLNVGFRIGAAIRDTQRQMEDDDSVAIGAGAEVAIEDETETSVNHSNKGGTVVGHIRRSHLHFFWYGKKDGSEERYKLLKLLPPISVNLKTLDDLIATERKAME